MAPALEDDRSSSNDLDSIRVISGSVISNTYDSIRSTILADLVEPSSMSTYLTDDATCIDGPESVSRHIDRMSAYLREFDDLFNSGLGPVLAQPIARPNFIQVYPAHRRQRGENPPFRSEDGVISTQPRRGSRRTSTQTNQNPAPSQTGDNPPESPRIRPRRANPHPNRDQMGQIFSPEDSPTGNGTRPAHINFTKHSAYFLAPNVHKQQDFSPGAFANPTTEAPVPSAWYQQFDQLSQTPPEQLGMPHCSAQLDQLSVRIPNNMVWQPYLCVFAQGQSHPPTASQSNTTQAPAFVTGTSNSGSTFHFPRSYCDSSFESMQNTSPHIQGSTGFFNNAADIPAQNTFPNSESGISSLHFRSSSSQTPSSSFESARNHIHPPPFVASGNQQERQPALHLRRIREHDPVTLLPERGYRDADAGEEGETLDQANDWEEWVDYYPNGEEE